MCLEIEVTQHHAPKPNARRRKRGQAGQHLLLVVLGLGRIAVHIDNAKNSTSNMAINIVETARVKLMMNRTAMKSAAPDGNASASNSRTAVKGPLDPMRRQLRREPLEVTSMPMALLQADNIIRSRQPKQHSMLRSSRHLIVRGVLEEGLNVPSTKR